MEHPRHIQTIVRTAIVAALLEGCALADGPMTYRDANAVTATLRQLAANSRNARVFTIGSSIDYQTDAANPVTYPILALRISADTAADKDDDLGKNGLLFECGMHSREWLATESCLSFAEYLVANAANAQTDVPGVLATLDIWIVPLTNVSGRRLDDAYGGDPNRYSTTPNSGGWRGDGDTRECNYGIDVARNFTRDWKTAPKDCGSKFRGFAPFAASEAVALRNFVQNHTISMAVVVHSNLQKIWNIWDDEDVAGSAISTKANQLWAANLTDQSMVLERTAFGRKEGQFSAWLARESDTAGEPDRDTKRAIQTIFVELPILDYSDTYASPAGTGNGFHPSSDKVKDLIQKNFIPMATGLAGMARTPGCISGTTLACPEADYALVGAKLGLTAVNAGKLETTVASVQGTVVTPALDMIAVGQYYVEFRAQNFSSVDSNQDFDVQVTVHDGASSQSQIQSFAGVARNDARTGQFAVGFPSVNTDYTVTLEVRPAGGFASGLSDSFRHNDQKVFKFRAYKPQ